MKVLILFNGCPPTTFARGATRAEFDLTAAADGIACVLPSAEVARRARKCAAKSSRSWTRGSRTWSSTSVKRLLVGPTWEAHVAALLEWQGVRYGSSSETLALCRRKDRTKAVLAAMGVPVPRAMGSLHRPSPR